MNHVLTVDIGTTSAKALIISDKGQVVASAQEFYPTRFPQPGFAVQDPKAVVDGILRIVREATSRFQGKVAAIGLSSAMHSLMAIDRRKNPLTPLILWSDMRSASFAKQLQQTPTGIELYHATGTPIHPMSPLCKLLWMREHEPEVMANTWKFISIKEYLVLILCNELRVDYSVASSTGLFDIHQLRWCTRALEVAGIGHEKLSDCISPYDTTLRLKADVASQLGLSPDIPVIPGASDGCLAHYGSDAMGEGQVSVTIGTSGAVRMATAKYAADPQRRIFNYRLDDQQFISGGATNNGTVLLSWFCNNFYSDKSLDIVGFAKTADEVEAGASGLLFLPYVFGERAPYYNPDMRGVFFGLAQHHTRAHMMRALLEGICMEIRSIVDSVEQSIGSVSEVLASGGFVRSPIWLQIMADVLGKPVTLRDVNDASSLGAARMAFRGLGVGMQFQRSGKELVYQAQDNRRETYDQLYGIFSRATRTLQGEFAEIVRLQQAPDPL